MKKIKLLIAIMFIAITSNAQDSYPLLDPPPQPQHNICDSITIINPNKQNMGEFIVDFRKAINLVDAKNTKWVYTYGDISKEDMYAKGFVPDTIVACIFSQSTNPITACGSKWVWNGLVWDKQKEVPEEQLKSTLNIIKK